MCTAIITQAAQEAAESSMDAHGYHVDAETAWSFVSMLWWDTEDERYADLEDSDGSTLTMPAAFATAYAQECAK